jgi:hypothetical protein
MKDWGILVVLPSAGDAPFTANGDFAKRFSQSLQDDCALFFAGHSMMTWRLHSTSGKVADLSSRVLGLPGDFKTVNPGALKLHEGELITRCAPVEKRK